MDYARHVSMKLFHSQCSQDLKRSMAMFMKEGFVHLFDVRGYCKSVQQAPLTNDLVSFITPIVSLGWKLTLHLLPYNLGTSDFHWYL